MTDFITPQSYETVTLDQLKVGITERVGRNVAESLKLKRWEEELGDGLVYGLSAYVLAETLPSVEEKDSRVISFEYPETWFQHLKQTCYRWHRLSWLACRWPARLAVDKKRVTLTVNLERYRTYPKANVALPDTFGAPVRVAITRNRWSHDAL